ncbi:helix-turn-helix domain-containing protein [Mesorhizobium sp. CA8]|uniref:helix-turn-helix domain-containing protein n=1 Tax=Mesorhizobium sp. CA8 TaxID=2876637 RepID=UPI001CCA7C52|nr:helix-turn-helix transcriptional regulator [Mesorhizobium sp. CA8]MBZ9759507.1 helix-turn-helix domain-containing protein [Mesorhizobium sp. CA8]
MTYEGDECLFWPYAKSRGYGSLQLDGKRTIVSRFACEHKNGPPPTAKHEAAHSCGNGHLGCVSKNHLSWKTHVENMHDKFSHWTDTRGARNWSAKLTKEEVTFLRSMKGKLSQSALSRMLGIHQSGISRIQSGKGWSSLD